MSDSSLTPLFLDDLGRELKREAVRTGAITVAVVALTGMSKSFVIIIIRCTKRGHHCSLITAMNMSHSSSLVCHFLFNSFLGSFGKKTILCNTNP